MFLTLRKKLIQRSNYLKKAKITKFERISVIVLKKS